MAKYRTLAPAPPPQPPSKNAKVVRAGHDDNDNFLYNQRLNRPETMSSSHGLYMTGQQASSASVQCESGTIDIAQQASADMAMYTAQATQASAKLLDQVTTTVQPTTPDFNGMDVEGMVATQFYNGPLPADDTFDASATIGHPAASTQNAQASGAPSAMTVLSNVVQPNSAPAPAITNQPAPGPIFNLYVHPMAPMQLNFTSFAQALPFGFRRVSMNISNDDFGIVAASQAYYVQQIMSALLNPNHLPAPSHRRSTRRLRPIVGDDIQRWGDWQAGASQKVQDILKSPNAIIETEVRAWAIVDEVLKIHTPGPDMGYRLTGLKVVTTLKCSQRLFEIVKVLSELKIVRQNLLEDKHLHDICSAPDAYGKERERQMWSNNTRDNKGKPKAQRKVRQAARADGLGRAAARRLTPAELKQKEADIKKATKKQKQKAAQQPPKTKPATASGQPSPPGPNDVEDSQQGDEDDADDEDTPRPEKRKRAA